MATTKEIIDQLSGRFNASAAGSMDAVFQFSIDNEHYNLAIKNGTCTIAEGEHDDPTVTLIMSSETLQGLVSGKVNGMQAFMMGKLKTQGNTMLATKLGPLFGLG